MQRTIVLITTLMLSGRAMTLAFVHRAGGDGPGDPPIGWLMPLIGDAVVGLSGLLIAYLIWFHRGLFVWAAIIVWNSIGIWDALSAYIIHRTVPWPEFFMLQMVGATMFFAASLMHLINLYLTVNDPFRSELLDEKCKAR